MTGGGKGGLLLQRETAGNDKGCKYLPLPGPGSCAELTGPPLGCWREEGRARWGSVGKGARETERQRERRKTSRSRVAVGTKAQQITRRL